MRLNRACAAELVLKKRQRLHHSTQPVVLSAEHFNGLIDRATLKDRKEDLQAIKEELAYKEYLKNGNAALMKRFTNMVDTIVKDDEEKQATRDKALAESTKDRQTVELSELRRTERIIRANRLLNTLKPGQRALQQGLIESELIYQRKYNDALNAEFAEAARHQQSLDEQQCQPALIPFGTVTEEQDKAQQLVKMNDARVSFLKVMEQQRQRKQAKKEQEMVESLVERERHKCLQEKEEKARKELLEKKRQFCLDAYRDSLKEKAEKARCK